MGWVGFLREFVLWGAAGAILGTRVAAVPVVCVRARNRSCIFSGVPIFLLLLMLLLLLWVMVLCGIARHPRDRQLWRVHREPLSNAVFRSTERE